MSIRNAELPPRLLRAQGAARILGISLRTLEKHRTYGAGPIYRKVGGHVVYAIDDLEAWSEIGARTATSDKDAGRVFPARPLTAAERSARKMRRNEPSERSLPRSLRQP